MGKLSDLRMHVIKNGTLLPYMVNPYAIPEDEIEGFFNTGSDRFQCRCGLIYELRRGDLALIPVTKSLVTRHEDSCPLSSRYIHRSEAISFDPLSGTLTAEVVGDIASRPERRKKGSGTGASSAHRMSPVKSLSPLALIKKLNLLTLYMEYEKRLASIKRGDDYLFKYYLTERFSRLAYSTARTLTVSGDKKMCGATLEKEGFAFFYRQLSGIEIMGFRGGEKEKAMHDERFSIDDLPVSEKSFIRLFFSEDGISPVRCSLAALREAMCHLNAPFVSGEIDFRGETVIAAGWMYPDRNKDRTVKRGYDGRIFPIIDRLALFSVNRYGVLIDSLSEMKATELIMLSVNKSPDLIFYKPFIVTDEFYDGKWMPRGVIKKMGAKRDIVIEVFDAAGSGKEQMEKVRLRDWEKHEYIDYFPSQELIGSFRSKLGAALSSIGKDPEIKG